MIRGYVAAFMEDEAILFESKEEGAPLTPVEDFFEVYRFRIAVKNKNGQTIAIYPVEFDREPDADGYYNFVTEITLEETAYVKIERSYDFVNFTDNGDNSNAHTPGEYEVHYSVRFRVGGLSSSFGVAPLGEYSADYIGSLIKEGDKFYRHDYASGDKETLVEIEYTEENGIYAFNVSYNEGYSWLYYVLGESRRFNAYVPETEALYTNDANRNVVKLYEGGYVVVFYDGFELTSKYALEEKESGYAVLNVDRFVMESIWNNEFRVDGELANGWQEGDIEAEVTIRWVNSYGNNRFVTGNGSVDDLQFEVYYSDGSRSIIKGSQVEIVDGTITLMNGNILYVQDGMITYPDGSTKKYNGFDFNFAGKYEFNGTYMDNYVHVWFEIGYPDQAYSRYIEGNDIVWLIDEGGNVTMDFAGVRLSESTFGGSYQYVNMSESDFNADDINAALNGNAGEVFEIGTTIVRPFTKDEYLKLKVILLTVDYIAENIENVNVNGPDIIYARDRDEFLEPNGPAYLEIDIVVETVREVFDGEGYIKDTWRELFSYRKKITAEDLITEETDYRNDIGRYKVRVSVDIAPEVECYTTVVTINYSDITFLSMFAQENGGEYSLPVARVRESMEAYRSHLIETLTGEVMYVAGWVVMSQQVYISGNNIYTFNESTFDFSEFDTSSPGVTYIYYNTTDLYGNPYSHPIEITVAYSGYGIDGGTYTVGGDIGANTGI